MVRPFQDVIILSSTAGRFLSLRTFRSFSFAAPRSASTRSGGIPDASETLAIVLETLRMDLPLSKFPSFVTP